MTSITPAISVTSRLLRPRFPLRLCIPSLSHPLCHLRLPHRLRLPLRLRLPSLSHPLCHLRLPHRLRLLKETAAEERQSALKQLGEWLRPRQDEFRGFRKVYSDSGLAAVLKRITRAWDLPASAAGFAIFLHWLDLTLHAGGVDLDAVATDCQELAGCLDGQAIVEGLWLLGFSSGFEAVAPGCYRRMGEKHPFNPTGRSGKRVMLLSLPPVATTEPVVPQQSEIRPPVTEKCSRIPEGENHRQILPEQSAAP